MKFPTSLKVLAVAALGLFAYNYVTMTGNAKPVVNGWAYEPDIEMIMVKADDGKSRLYARGIPENKKYPTFFTIQFDTVKDDCTATKGTSVSVLLGETKLRASVNCRKVPSGEYEPTLTFVGVGADKIQAAFANAGAEPVKLAGQSYTATDFQSAWSVIEATLAK